MYYHYYEYGDEGKGGWHRVRPHCGVRTQRYKLIHFHDDEIDAWELFDLRNDPHELKNVYDDPEYASVIDPLKAELQRLRHLYNDSE
jgi:arylsulfatase A-like enzyme